MSIGIGAFYACTKLLTIRIPESVISINSDAFSTCVNLVKVYYEGTQSNWFNKVTVSSGNNFLLNAEFDYESGVSNIEVVDDGILEYILVDNMDAVIVDCVEKDLVTINLQEHLIGTKIIAIFFGAFRDCTLLTSITLPITLTSIERLTFENCTSLKSIIIPENVIFIGFDAFYNCASLANVILPAGLATIDSKAFYLCDSLTKVIIPSSVTIIGEYAFAFCTKLTIYARTPSKPVGRHERWNYSNRPVVWGYTG